MGSTAPTGLLDSYATAQLSVIGSMMIDDKCVPVVLSKMRADDFTDSTCRATYQAILRLVRDGRPVDPVTVVDAMQGGETYARWLGDLMQATPTAANVAEYVDIAQRGSALYQLRCSADKLLCCTDLDEAKDEVRRMSSLLSGTSRMESWSATDLAKDFIARMSSQDKPEYLPWGIPSADRCITAELGDMILLGGRPSSGKTLLSILFALSQAKRYRVRYYTLETQPRKMADRMFAHLAKLSLSDIKHRNLSENAMGRIAEASSLFVSKCPIDFVRAAGSSVDDIMMDAIGHGAQIIYVDYIQLIGGPGRNDYERVSAVSRALKQFAQANNVAVVALAQLARSEKMGKDRKPVPPSMDSFRESGQLEQDADAALLLWPEDPDDNRSRRILKLGKNKEGGKFRVSLSFNGATQTMVEIEDQPSTKVAGELAAQGRAIKRKQRSQVSFADISDTPNDDCPF